MNKQYVCVQNYFLFSMKMISCEVLVDRLSPFEQNPSIKLKMRVKTQDFSKNGTQRPGYFFNIVNQFYFIQI